MQQKVADIQYEQQVDQIGTSREIIGFQSEAEGVRRAAVNLDATRRSRQRIREAAIAQSLSVARAVGQGVRTTDTAVQGATAQISTQLGESLLGIRQARMSSNRLFDINEQITGTYLAAQDRSLGYLGRRQDLERQQRENQIRSIELSKQTSQAGANIAQHQSNVSLGQGISGVGGLVLSNAGGIARSVQSFPGLFGANTPNYGGFGRTSGTAIY